VQAYRLYTLALAGKAEIGAMNRMRQLEDLNATAKWRLAVAYALAGQKGIANTLVQDLGVDIEDDGFSALTYGSYLRDKAMILEALVLLERKAQAFEMAMSIAQDLNNGNWYSTQTTAYALLGLTEFIKKNASGTASIKYNIAGQADEFNFTKGIYTIDLKDKVQDELKVKMTNMGKNDLYIRVVNEGQPTVGYEEEVAKGLNVTVVYTDRNGIPIDVSELKQGTDFKARVNIAKVGNLRGYQNMALTQIFPSGWEIVNLRLMERNANESTYRYRDYRDDRVMTYFSLPGTKSVTYEVWLNASYAGKYYLSGAKVEDMYDNRIEVVKKGQWVEVKK
jgi:uncharacterized protein YfaS (alpha-2-macroglobulin family)